MGEEQVHRKPKGCCMMFFGGGGASSVWISNGDVTKSASKQKFGGDLILAFCLPVSFGCFFVPPASVLGKFSMLNKVPFFVSS